MLTKIKQLSTEALVEMQMEAMKPSKKTKRIGIIVLVIAMVMMMTVTAFGAGEAELVTKVNNFTKLLFKYILGVSTGLAILFIAINIVKIMLSSDSKATSEAKKAIIKVVIAWVALNSMTAIANIIGTFADKGNGMSTWKPPTP